MEQEQGLFCALLKYWRKRRGLSQLDLAMQAEISPRHLSFLETGRAKPSKEMVLKLASTLSIPLRQQNELMRAASFHDYYPNESLTSTKLEPVSKAIDQMLDKHDPFPMVVMDQSYNLIKSNISGTEIISTFVANPASLVTPINLLEMIFNPDLSRPYVQNWEETAQRMLTRLYREALEQTHNKSLSALVSKLLAFPDVPEEWKYPDFSNAFFPVNTLSLKKGDLHLSFLMTMTCFSSPASITIEELMIESYFPLDEKTSEACSNLLQSKQANQARH